MKRLFIFTLQLAFLVALVVWLADEPGTARIIWHGYVIETPAAFLGLCIIAAGMIFYSVFRLWHLVRRGPEHWRLRRKLNKLREGQEHLTAGLIAVAGGNAAEAGKQVVQARRLLGTTPATRLLQAQAAQLAGDHRAAQEIFRALAVEPSSAVLGYRGLIMQARREGNWSEMERLAEKLHRLKPKTPWLDLVRFELLTRKKEWGEASDALERISSSRLLDLARIRHHRAALLAAISRKEAKQGRYDKALQAAERAAKQAPDWLPAILILAQAQMLAGHRRAMQRTVARNWKSMPHPQLANVLRSAEADPVEACKQIERLCRDGEDMPVSRLVMAEAAFAADIWGAARRNLMALVSRGEVTQLVYRLMARLERRESGDEQAALQWMTRAADAPADPTWLCAQCGGVHKEWDATCGHCGGFNTLDWQSPGVSRGGGRGSGIGLQNDVHEYRMLGTEY